MGAGTHPRVGQEWPTLRYGAMPRRYLHRRHLPAERVPEPGALLPPGGRRL